MRFRWLVGAGGVALLALGGACSLEESGLLDPSKEPRDASTPPPTDATMTGSGGDSAGDGPPATNDEAGAGDGNDGSEAGADAGPDTADAGPNGPDAGPCEGGVVCNGLCMAGSSSCLVCLGAPLLCAATRVCGSDCNACPSAPIQCFNCDSNRANPVGTCQPQDTNAYCLNDGDYPGDHCACPTNDAGDCPGATQTCSDLGGIFDPGNVCKTCGEANTDGAACKGGGTCNAASATCK